MKIEDLLSRADAKAIDALIKLRLEENEESKKGKPSEAKKS